MENIKLNIEKTLDFISKEKLASYEPKVNATNPRSRFLSLCLFPAFPYKLLPLVHKKPIFP